ncbi:MAG: MarR family winged helix-turn-helix transcriptional regulator [Patulibacter sp.]
MIDHLARLMRVGAEAALTPLGLRPRHLVALTVLRDHGEATQQSLSAALQIDRTNLVGLLNDLEEEGLAVRRRSPEDRRRHIVTLTALGAERLAQAELALTAVEGDLLGALDEEERETLYRLLQRATGGHVGGCTEAAAPAPAVCLEHPADCD